MQHNSLTPMQSIYIYLSKKVPGKGKEIKATKEVIFSF